VIRNSGGEDGFRGMCGLDLPGVKEWLLCPGMLFRSAGKWWGNRGLRRQPHEGLDLLLYRDQEDRILHLDKTTGIPAVSDGVVVGMISDFLGKSIIVEHPVPDSDNARNYTIYAHTSPQDSICAGTAVSRGDTIATLAGEGRSPFPVAAHLHISTAWAPQPVSCDRFNWDTIGVSEMLILLDPLDVVACRYQILEDGDVACQGL